VQVCAQSSGGDRLSYTASARGEYFWGGGWYENDRPVRVTTHVEVRDVGTTLTSRTTQSDATPWCSLWIGCTPAHPTTQATLTHAPVTSGLVVGFWTQVTGMYWSDRTQPNPGPSDISGIRQTVYIPATALTRVTDPAVQSVRYDGTTLSVQLDPAAFAGDDRYIVRVDGEYAMESQAGQRYYASGTTTGSTAELSRRSPGLEPGTRVEVVSSDGRPGEAATGTRTLATYTVE
jgi:membrane protein implicated in regulation of membrane protease activity